MISSGGSLTSLVMGGREARGSRWGEAGSCSSTSPGRRRWWPVTRCDSGWWVALRVGQINVMSSNRSLCRTGTVGYPRTLQQKQEIFKNLTNLHREDYWLYNYGILWWSISIATSLRNGLLQLWYNYLFNFPFQPWASLTIILRPCQ